MFKNGILILGALFLLTACQIEDVGNNDTNNQNNGGTTVNLAGAPSISEFTPAENETNVSVNPCAEMQLNAKYSRSIKFLYKQIRQTRFPTNICIITS